MSLLFIMLNISLFNAHNLCWKDFPVQKENTHKIICIFNYKLLLIYLIMELFNIYLFMFFYWIVKYLRVH